MVMASFSFLGIWWYTSSFDVKLETSVGFYGCKCNKSFLGRYFYTSCFGANLGSGATFGGLKICPSDCHQELAG